jgi:hypothetical protein
MLIVAAVTNLLRFLYDFFALLQALSTCPVHAQKAERGTMAAARTSMIFGESFVAQSNRDHDARKETADGAGCVV